MAVGTLVCGPAELDDHLSDHVRHALKRNMTKIALGKETLDQHKSENEPHEDAILPQKTEVTPQTAPLEKNNGSIARAESQASPDKPISPGLAISPPDEVFYSSPNSRIAKSRKRIWTSLSLAALIVLANSKGEHHIIVFLLSLILLGVGLDWLLRRQEVRDRPAVIITRDSIESQLFSGKIKKYPWNAVTSFSFERKQNLPLLQLQLDSTQGFPDKRNFWTGHNYSRPQILLSYFEPNEQEKLYDAIRRHLRGDTTSPAATRQGNPLTEEREFQERLKSFAPIPWATYGLIALNVLIWAASVVQGASLINTPPETLLGWGGNATSEFQKGEWWRLLTAMFLHSGLMNVIMNMVGLAVVGITVERIYGCRQYILIFLGTGLIGNALSLHFSAQHAVSVGASGAVFGIMGALLVGMYQHRTQLPKTLGKSNLISLGFFIVYCLTRGFAQPGIDNAAHIGGLLAGCFLAYILPEQFDREHYVKNLTSRTIVGLAMVVAAISALAITAPHAVVDQKRVIEGQAAFVHAMTGFQKAMKALQEEQQNVTSGKITERESDERSRTVFAPMLRQVIQNLSLAYLPPSDPRTPVLKDSKRLSMLLLEALEMKSNYKEGSDKPVPANPARMAAIEAETTEVGQLLEQHLAELKAKQNMR